MKSGKGGGRAAKPIEGKKREKPSVIEQWVQVHVEDGRTVTERFPSDEELRKQAEEMERLPTLVYRRLDFVDGVPVEYWWATRDAQRRQYGGCGIQRMTYQRWLLVVEAEKEYPDGRALPTGVGNLPRPKERGGCECGVCGG